MRTNPATLMGASPEGGPLGAGIDFFRDGTEFSI
jgi:hypothetical protein